MELKTINIAFTDFYTDFNPQDNFIINTLRKKYDVQIVCDKSQHVDILFYSFQGSDHYLWPFDIIRVYFTGENDVPDFNECDYGISFQRINFGNRHLRLPLYCVHGTFDGVFAKRTLSDADAINRGFCSAVLSNSVACEPYRLSIIEKIIRIRDIGFGGSYKNNVGGRVPDKISFCKKYKFNLALENSKVDGYITEKIVDAFASEAIPIYWGAQDVVEDFNPGSFINLNDFNNLDEAVEYIKKVDSDDSLYLKMLNEEKINRNNQAISWEQDLQAFLDSIITNPHKYTSKYGYSGRRRLNYIEMNAYFENALFRHIFRLFLRLFKKNIFFICSHRDIDYRSRI